MSDRKVLVTGANGFLGQAVVRHLTAAGYPVRSLVRKAENDATLKGLNVEIVRGDVTNAAEMDVAVSGCKIVIHLASSYEFYPWWDKKAERLYAVNVQGTKNLLEVSLKNGAERFIFASSVAAAADKTSHYARSKLLAEEEILKFTSKGLFSIILRPGIIFGEGDRKPTPSGEIILKFLHKEYPCYFDTNFPLADVNDVARAFVAAIEKGRPGVNYTLCDSQAHSFQEVFSLLEDISQIKAPRLKVPYGALLGFSYIDEAVSVFILRKKPLMPSEGLKFCHMPGRADNSSAVRELGFAVTPVRETLLRAVNWYKENG